MRSRRKPVRRTGPTPDVIETVRQRDGACLRCGSWNPVFGLDPHHRKLKGAGGTRDPRIHYPSVLVTLCRECHTHVHDVDRAGAERDGWIVRSLDAALTTPVQSYRGRLWLDDLGRALVNSPTGEADA